MYPPRWPKVVKRIRRWLPDTFLLENVKGLTFKRNAKFLRRLLKLHLDCKTLCMLMSAIITSIKYYVSNIPMFRTLGFQLADTMMYNTRPNQTQTSLCIKESLFIRVLLLPSHPAATGAWRFPVRGPAPEKAQVVDRRDKQMGHQPCLTEQWFKKLMMTQICSMLKIIMFFYQGKFKFPEPLKWTNKIKLSKFLGRRFSKW